MTEPDSPDSSDTPRTAIVPASAAGRRFDAALAELFPEFSRSRLTEWIKSGNALLDGQVVRPRDPVRGGETASLDVVLDTQTHAEPEDIPLDILYEDEHVFVLDKPAGLVVHPGAGNPTGTLVNALLFRDPSLSALPRAGIVHRLDKDTSGVMVVARTLPAHTSLVAQLASRDVHRQYLAVVVGAMVSGGTANAPIDLHFLDNTDPGGMDDVFATLGDGLAETLVIVISKSGGTAETRNGMLETEAAFKGRGLDFAKLAEIEITRQATDEVLDRAGLHIDDIDLVELHDAFTVEEVEYVEAMGLCKPGTAVPQQSPESSCTARLQFCPCRRHLFFPDTRHWYWLDTCTTYLIQGLTMLT